LEKNAPMGAINDFWTHKVTFNLDKYIANETDESIFEFFITLIVF